MITVYGTLCLDRLHQVPHLPHPGGYVEILRTQAEAGGEAYNTAFSLRKWNHDHVLIANSLGWGPDAELLRKIILDKNIPAQVDLNEEQVTPVCDIYVTPDGERTIFGVGFAELSKFSQRDDAKFISGKWFTCDPNLSDTSIFFAEQAKARGSTIYYMDFELEGEESPEYRPQDIWQTSTDRFGKKGDLQANLAAIEKAHSISGSLCILTDSKNGFVLCGPDTPAAHYPPFRAPGQIDSTGAGDCFRAGLLHGLDSGKSLSDALAFAAAAASLACQGFGATTSIPSLDQVNQLITEQAQTLLTYRQLGL